MVKISIIGFWLAVVALTFAACFTGGTIGRPEVSVVSENLTVDAGGKTVLLVTIHNTGPIKAELTEVSVKFFDMKKNLLDSGKDAVMNLERDETAQLTIPCDSSLGNISSYEISVSATTSR
jgi:hypothetical protein